MTMWSQDVREAIALFTAFAESKFIEVREVAAGFISEYRTYILVGLLILVILVIMDLWIKWQGKREKKRIDDEIDDQMQDK